MSTAHPGAGLASAIARIVGETIIHSKAATADHEQTAKWRATTAAMEHAETIYTPILRDIFGELASMDNVPEQYKSLAKMMLQPDAQWGVMIQLFAFLSSAISLVFSMGQPIAQEVLNQVWQQNPSKVIPAADLADMVTRNVIDQSFGEESALLDGVAQGRFDLMVLNAGEPYGIVQGLELLRRGLITEEWFRHVVHYSRVRDEFIPDLLQLAHATMTPGDAIELALKEIVPHAQAVDYFSKGGGLPDQFDDLLAAAGNPIGPEKAVELWQHGLIDEAELRKIVAHSRINPMFYNDIKLTHRKWLQVFQIELALKAGTLRPAVAAEMMAADGYDQSAIAAFVTAAASGKTSAHKTLTEAQITTLYDTGFFTKAQAGAELQAMGYEPGETDFILAYYDQRRKLTMAQAAINLVRKHYLAGRIDDTAAHNDLNALGVDPGAITNYLDIWRVEKQFELRELTPAQVGSMYKKGLFTDAQALARFEAFGYSTGDAALMLANYGGPPPAGTPAAGG